MKHLLVAGLIVASCAFAGSYEETEDSHKKICAYRIGGQIVHSNQIRRGDESEAMLALEQETLKNWFELKSRVDLDPANPSPFLFISDEEFADQNFGKSMSPDESEIWAAYPSHETWDTDEERQMVSAFRIARNEDLKSGKVERDAEEAPWKPDSNRISLAQWQLLNRYHVPLPGSPMPLSEQIRRVITYHNVRLAHFGSRKFYAWFKRIKPVDFVGIGVQEIFDCVPRFDPNKAGRLSTYLGYRIRPKMQRYLYENGLTARAPSGVWSDYSAWEGTKQFVILERGGSDHVSDEERYRAYPDYLFSRLKEKHSLNEANVLLKARLKRENYDKKELFLEKRRKMMDHFGGNASLFGALPRNEDGETDPHSLDKQPSPSNEGMSDLREGANALRALLAPRIETDIPFREKWVLRMRLGLVDWEELYGYLAARFADDMQDEENQKGFIEILVPFYHTSSPLEKLWEQLRKPEILEAVRELLQQPYPSGIASEGVEGALDLRNPFFKIYRLLGENPVARAKDLLSLNKKNHGLAKVGILMRVTRERIRQVQARGTQRLRFVIQRNKDRADRNRR